MTKTLAALASAAAVLLLTGCTAAAEPQETDASTASATPTPTADDTAVSAWTAPDSCLALDLVPGTTMAGSALGACVGEALSSYGSGKEYIESDQGTGEVVFRYDPDFEMQGTVEGPDGPMTLTYLDDTMWIDEGDGPVKGDVTSTDPDEMLAGLAGELYRMFSDPSVATQLIAAGAEWKVSATEPVELGNGETVDAVRIEVLGAYTWNEIPISDYVVWFEEDWTPVGAEATVSVAGVSGTARQTFYDLGEPVEITPVG